MKKILSIIICLTLLLASYSIVFAGDFYGASDWAISEIESDNPFTDTINPNVIKAYNAGIIEGDVDYISETAFEKCDNVTFVCEKGTNVASYALENGIKVTYK